MNEFCNLIKMKTFICALVIIFSSFSSAFAQNFTDQTFVYMPEASAEHGLYDGKVALADYNNDGYMDILSGGNIWRNNGGTSNTWALSMQHENV